MLHLDLFESTFDLVEESLNGLKVVFSQLILVVVLSEDDLELDPEAFRNFFNFIEVILSELLNHDILFPDGGIVLVELVQLFEHLGIDLWPLLNRSSHVHVIILHSDLIQLHEVVILKVELILIFEQVVIHVIFFIVAVV